MRVHGQVAAAAGEGLRGIGGVAVTDGASVVLTDAAGHYAFHLHPEAEFVYLSLPAGYRIPRDAQNRAQFYQPVAAGPPFDFLLKPQAPQEAFTFLYVTDMHLDHSGGDQFVAETITSIAALNPAPAFVVCGGDISLQGRAEEAYVRALASLTMPCFNAVGNHELLVGEADPKGRFKALFGPTYYSFNAGPFHFVVLDGTQPEPSRQGWKNVVGALGERELRWLAQDLAALPSGTPVVGFCHIPLISTYSERRGLASSTAEPAWEITNAGAVLAVLRRHAVRCILQGHMHENEHAEVDGIQFVTSGAASGKWWRGPNPDGCPRGFRLVHIAGEALTSEYRATQPGAGGAHMAVCAAVPEEQIGRPVRIEASVFDGRPAHDHLWCRVGEREPWELTPMTGVLHRWVGYVPLGEDADRQDVTVTLQRAGLDIEVCTMTVPIPAWSAGH